MALHRTIATLTEELRAWRAGLRHVAGVDEAGRGPMAGPVVAAAVILDPQYAALWWSELRDSKLVSARQRERLAGALHEAAAVGVGSASHEEIDGLGLLVATRQAMRRALEALPCRPDMLLIDAVSLGQESADLDGPRWNERPIIHGDGLSVSIAAASVVAKVARDRVMDEYDAAYPAYGFGHNRGYCTLEHLRALDEHGPSPIHRQSFAPVRAYLERHS